MSIIIGLLFTLTGGVVWGVVSSQLAAEKITVPNDAHFMQGALVSGPVSALAQADIISTHALKASKGLTMHPALARRPLLRRTLAILPRLMSSTPSARPS
ncbi:hypothetical protein [Propioniciclava flava]